MHEKYQQEKLGHHLHPSSLGIHFLLNKSLKPPPRCHFFHAEKQKESFPHMRGEFFAKQLDFGRTFSLMLGVTVYSSSYHTLKYISTNQPFGLC